MRRIRFSLRVLILSVTAIGLFLGFSQYRRREILKLSEELTRDGYVFSVPTDWRDHIWQRRPNVGFVRYVDGKVTLDRAMKRELFDGEKGTVLDVTSDPQEIERLKKLGVVEYK